MAGLRETSGHRRTMAVVCDWVPYPVRSGDNRRTGEMIDVLREHGWCVHLVLTRAPLTKNTRALCMQNVDRVHLFWGRNPLSNLLRFAVQRIDNVLYSLELPLAGEMVGRLMGRKRHLATELFSPMPKYRKGFKEWMRRRARRYGWDAVLINFMWLHAAVDELPEGTLTLLDTIDLQHKRVEQFDSRGIKHIHSVSRHEEAAAMSKFDAVIAIQREEAAEIRAMCPSQTVITAGTSSMPADVSSTEAPPDLVLYVGGDNAANIDGLRRFLENCWPRIRTEQPAARLRVCGYVYQAFLFETYDGVDFAGYVDDIEQEYARAWVVVNPIWIGTGLKIKTVEALARGKPLVTTGKGIEGMFGDPSVACVVVDTHRAFSEEVVRLLQSPGECARLGLDAQRYSDAFLSRQAVYRDLLEFLDLGVPRGDEQSSPGMTALLERAPCE